MGQMVEGYRLKVMCFSEMLRIGKFVIVNINYHFTRMENFLRDKLDIPLWKYLNCFNRVGIYNLKLYQEIFFISWYFHLQKYFLIIVVICFVGVLISVLLLWRDDAYTMEIYKREAFKWEWFAVQRLRHHTRKHGSMKADVMLEK